MLTFSRPAPGDERLIAEFIANMNSRPELHIGYCGTDADDIERDMAENFTEVPFEECFVVARNGGVIAGVLGFDPDMAHGRAELWGPFAKDGSIETAERLFAEAAAIFPESIVSAGMFVNSSNRLCLELAARLGFEKRSDEAILEARLETFSKAAALNAIPGATVEELRPERHRELIALHEAAFPGTYYDGTSIVARAREGRRKKAFTCDIEGGFAGYVYAEAGHGPNEGSIEFFAVDGRFRGHGIGALLLRSALEWLFSEGAAKSVKLCVNSANDGAIRLYERAGFEVRHRMEHFVKKCRIF